MRTGQLHVEVADRHHADEVGRTRQECRERRGERNGAARRKPHRRADHHLFGDEILVEAFRERLLEFVAEGGILDVGVKCDDTRVGGTELGERQAVGFTRGNLFAQLEVRCRHRRRRGWCGGTHRLHDERREVEPLLLRHEVAVQLSEHLVELFALLERLAVPVVLALGDGNALALHRPRHDHRRLALDGARLGERIEHLVQVVAVDGDGVPAERAPAAGELVEVVLPHRRAALTETVHVGDGAEVIEAVLRGHCRRFPDRAFSRFTVAEQAVGAVVGADAAGVQRAADGGADALAKRPGGDVDKRQARRWVPFEIRVKVAHLQQLGAIEEAGLRPRRVENRRGVPLREHEAIGAGVLRVFRIEPEFREEQGRNQFGGRRAAGRMAGARRGRRNNGVDAQPGGNVGESGNENGTIHVGHREMLISECRMQICARLLRHMMRSRVRPQSAGVLRRALKF